MGIGDWGLGIGDWGLAQSPIPNPQSPIPIIKNKVTYTKFQQIKLINLINTKIIKKPKFKIKKLKN